MRRPADAALPTQRCHSASAGNLFWAGAEAARRWAALTRRRPMLGAKAGA